MQKNSGSGKRKLYRVKGRSVIQFASLKNQCAIHLSSHLEQICALVLEFDNRISYYSTQTETYVIEDFKYTPDFMAITANKEVIYIEPHAKIYMNEEFERRLPHIRKFFEDRNQKFILLNEDQLTRNRAQNLQCLYDYRHLPANSYFELIEALPKQTTTLQELVQLIKELSGDTNSSKARLAALTLIAHQYYWFDDLSILTNDTKLWKTES